ncbi:MAG: putative ABC transporter permease protein NosY [Acidimicrobiales bacterium]|nr:putative ABC transporter permease protein NosY [Acidimicrobiales bacterium]
MTAATAPAGIDSSAVSERVEPRLVGVIALKVLREAVRDRWFWLYCAGFALLAAGITTLALPDTEVVGTGGFGRTAASLVALVQLVVTLMALTLGARSLAGERESGTLRFLLSHPVSRTEVLLGTYLGLGGALLAAVAAGFGVAGLVSSFRSAVVDVGILLKIAGASWLMALVMLGIGMLVSVVVRRTGAAMGAALLIWLGLVFLGDLGIMGTVAATNLPAETLFAVAVANPIEAFRLTAIVSLEGSLDALGPAGTYAVDSFGNSIGWLTLGVLFAWAVAPMVLAWLLFRRKKDL